MKIKTKLTLQNTCVTAAVFSVVHGIDLSGK